MDGAAILRRECSILAPFPVGFRYHVWAYLFVHPWNFCARGFHGLMLYKKLVTWGLEAPDKIKIFSSSVQWIFQPSQCFVNIATLKMATKCHEDGRQNTLSMVFAGNSAPHHFQNFSFLRRIVFILNFSVPRPTTGTSPCRYCFFSKHIDTLGWTTAVGWVGQAIDACLYTATNEALAPCPQLINT